MEDRRLELEESARLEALRRYEVLDGKPDPDLEDLARLAREVCGVPMGLVNFVDAERQLTRAASGIATGETPREHSFCAHTMRTGDLMVVEDARRDPAFARNPQVTGPPGIVFYAGAALVSPDGQPLGALCVIDREPRQLTERQADALRVLAHQVVAQLELRRLLRRQERELSEGRRSQAELRRRRGDLEAEVRQRNAELERANRELLEEVAQRQRAEAELRRERDTVHQTEKLAAMGELLAGVAHELNNPLAVALGQSQMLRRQGAEPRQTARLEKIEAAVERCARIVRNFLALARQQPPERRRVYIKDALEQAAELVGYGLRSDGVELRLDSAPDMPPVWADGHQLQQVLINLLTNAHHALHGRPGPKHVAVRARYEPKASRVVLEVEDNGPGIPEEVKPRIFDPFFTTKPQGQGTGLGLSLCKGIVESHGGLLRVESQAGRGTLFRIELPDGKREAAQAVDAAIAPALPVTPADILVVDDEPEVRELLAEVLESDGHSVETAANGSEALARLAARRFDLVLSDLRMPLLDGPGLYERAVAAFPQLRSRFVFMTGDALTPETRDFLAGSPAPFLAKPFEMAELRDLVARALAGRGTGRRGGPAR